jgi:hypothetical protein
VRVLHGLQENRRAVEADAPTENRDHESCGNDRPTVKPWRAHAKLSDSMSGWHCWQIVPGCCFAGGRSIAATDVL